MYYDRVLLSSQLSQDKSYLLFERRWPKFRKARGMHCVSNFVLNTNWNILLFIEIHCFVLIVWASSC